MKVICCVVAALLMAAGTDANTCYSGVLYSTRLSMDEVSVIPKLFRCPVTRPCCMTANFPRRMVWTCSKHCPATSESECRTIKGIPMCWCRNSETKGCRAGNMGR